MEAVKFGVLEKRGHLFTKWCCKGQPKLSISSIYIFIVVISRNVVLDIIKFVWGSWLEVMPPQVEFWTIFNQIFWNNGYRVKIIGCPWSYDTYIDGYWRIWLFSNNLRWFRMSQFWYLLRRQSCIDLEYSSIKWCYFDASTLDNINIWCIGGWMFDCGRVEASGRLSFTPILLSYLVSVAASTVIQVIALMFLL